MFVLNTLPPYRQGIVSRLIQALKMDDSGNIKKKPEFFRPFRDIHNVVSEQGMFYLPFDKISDYEPSNFFNSQPSCKSKDMVFFFAFI